MNDFGRLDVIVTIERNGGILSDPARFVTATRRSASNESVDADLMFVWTAEKVITSIAVAQVPDEPSASPVALSLVSEALRNPAASVTV